MAQQLTPRNHRLIACRSLTRLILSTHTAVANQKEGAKYCTRRRTDHLADGNGMGCRSGMTRLRKRGIL